jgi:hypothetical protein
MQYVIGSVLALGTAALAVGAITGRVKIRSCCAPGDPAQDRRMRTAGAGAVSRSDDADPPPATPESVSACAEHEG